MEKKFTVISLFVLLIPLAVIAKPVVIQYSTYLTNAQKQPRTDINGRTVYFRLYNTQTGGSKLWEEQQTVTASNGFVSVVLGSNTPLPARVIDTVSALWLEMEIASETAFARQPIYAGFYSLSAGFADTALFAQSAGIALQSSAANKADSLGDKPASAYALVNQIPAISGNADSLGGYTADAYVRGTDTISMAKNTDSLGGRIAGDYALNSDIPVISGNADSLGGMPAASYVRNIDTVAIAKNADSLGSIAANRYLLMSGNGKAGIDTTAPFYKLHVNGDTKIEDSLVIGGFTSLGGDVAIKTKRIETTFDGIPSTIVINHGLTDFDIVAIHARCRINLGNYCPPNYDGVAADNDSSAYYSIFWNRNQIFVSVKTGHGSQLANDPIELILIYKENKTWNESP